MDHAELVETGRRPVSGVAIYKTECALKCLVWVQNQKRDEVLFVALGHPLGESRLVTLGGANLRPDQARGESWQALDRRIAAARVCSWPFLIFNCL